MKSNLIVLLLGLLGPGWVSPAPAQTPLEAQAARQQVQDFIRSTDTRLRDLEDALQAQQKRIAALEDQNRQLRAELARASRNNPAGGLDASLKQLADDIRTVDQKRIADSKLTVDKIDKIERLIREAASQAKNTPPPAPVTVTERPKIPASADVYEYTVESGDTLTRIVAKFRDQGFEVTQKMIEDANPGVNWRKLKINQTIVVPAKK